jgi:hypothetical protein
MANLDESDAVNTFLEAVGHITKVLCSLLFIVKNLLERYWSHAKWTDLFWWQDWAHAC